MGNKEPTLAFTVHHKGRKYLAGTGAEEIGAAAKEIGAHAWTDGRAPEDWWIPAAGGRPGGSALGSPPVPPLSALPPVADGQGGGDGDSAPKGSPGDQGDSGPKGSAGDDEGDSGPKKSTGRRAGSGS